MSAARKTEPERDRWGRYKLTDPTNPDAEVRAWTRATTLAETLNDSYGLTQWKMRNVVLGIAARPSLYDLACGSDPEDKKQLDDLCQKAMDAVDGDAKANQGTALHKFTARLDAGELDRAPSKWKEDLNAYQAFKVAKGIETTPRYIERVTVVPELEVAGTMDRIVRENGVVKIGDVKTGSLKPYNFLAIAIQLAVYAHGKGLFNLDTGLWEPMPSVDQKEGLVLSLPATMADPKLYRVDLEFGWRAAKAAYMVRQWRKDQSIFVLDGEPNNDSR